LLRIAACCAALRSRWNERIVEYASQVTSRSTRSRNGDGLHVPYRARGTHPTYVQMYLGHASVQLTFCRYSPGVSTMGSDTADAIDEALG
jgi:hypothetical protein